MPSAKSSHNHKHCVYDAMRNASAVCEDMGVRLTPIRKRVLELIWNSHQAVKAYDILHKLDSKDGSQTPPTVYRALDFLQEHGLVHKVESLNAYIGCTHPTEQHGCQFFICSACNEVQEFCDDTITERLRKNAQKVHFQFDRQFLEVHGVCHNCRQ